MLEKDVFPKLAKEGKTGSQIGVFLRDVYGIPSVRLVTQKKMGAMLTEKKLGTKLPEDLLALIVRAVQIRKHLEANHLDQPARRGLHLTESTSVWVSSNQISPIVLTTLASILSETLFFIFPFSSMSHGLALEISFPSHGQQEEASSYRACAL